MRSYLVRILVQCSNSDTLCARSLAKLSGLDIHTSKYSYIYIWWAADQGGARGEGTVKNLLDNEALRRR
jgi:hypothetical protein